MYQKMPEWYDAYNIVTLIPDFYMELTREQAGVLCGLINKYQPRKILELGAAAGGSTCLILKSLELLGLSETVMYSLDINERFYRGKEKETGWILKENKEEFTNYKKHTFLLGKLAVERVKEIGDGIDFLFLDTVHSIPGEILDFLLLYPYLSSNAIVVLHDTNLHHESSNEKAICNRVLVNSVTADKFYTSRREFLNIGAFRITDVTYNYIENVFASLLLPWTYYVNDEIGQKYREAYKTCYSEELLAIYDNALEMARLHYRKMRNEGGAELIDNIFASDKKVYVYGCGDRGKRLLRYLEDHSYSIAGMLVSDEVDIEAFSYIIEQGKNIYHFSNIPTDARESIIILAVAADEVRTLLDNSAYEYIDLKDVFWRFI